MAKETRPGNGQFNGSDHEERGNGLGVGHEDHGNGIGWGHDHGDTGGPGPNEDDTCPTDPPPDEIKKIVGDGASNILEGFSDYMNFIVGNDSADLITGGGYSDTVLGNGGDDLIETYCGDDSILAGQGDDTVYGGKGDDTISGDLGADHLFGDEGADVFLFKAFTIQDDTYDYIEDYEVGIDSVRLQNIDESTVSVVDEADGAAIYVDGNLEAIVLDTAAADVTIDYITV